MAWYRCGGGGLPSGLQSDMDAVLNKKFSTSTTYPPTDWAPTVNLMGPLPEKTSSGAIAHITDGADGVPVKNWLVTLPASLSGYSSVTAYKAKKNLFDNEGFFPSGGSVSSYYFKQFDYNSGLIPRIRLKEGVTYTFSIDVTSTIEPFNFSVGCGNGAYSADILTVYNKNNGRVSITFTPTSAQLNNGDIFAFRCPRYQAQNTFDYSISNVQLEFGSTATAYEAYSAPTQYTASLESTIYGGVIDLVSGTGTDDRLRYELDENDSWSVYSGTTHSFWHNVATGDDRPIDQTKLSESICNELTYSTISPSSAPDFSFLIQGGQRIVVTADSTIDTVEKFKTWLSTHPLVFIVPSATPTPISFTPIPTPNTALATNNFWADEGDSDVTYRADIDLLLGGQ